MSSKKDWGTEFMNSSWSSKGSDPRSERKVRRDFRKKREEAKSRIDNKSFWQKAEELYQYVIHGDDLSVKALIAGALLYFISPADFIPDMIPALGYVDDVAIVLMVYNRVKNALEASKVKHSGKTPNPDMEKW